MLILIRKILACQRTMALVFSSWLLDVSLLLLCVVVALYAYAVRNFGYWRKKGVPYMKPWPVAGNLTDMLLFRKCIGVQLQDLHDRNKDKPYVGIFVFDQPVLLVRDLDIIKDILAKDFQHFPDKGFIGCQQDTLFNEALFARKGRYWKDLRTKLSPAFSTGKMKRMFHLVEEKAARLDKYFDVAAESGEPVDVKDALGKFTTDVVASVGFGINSNSLENTEDEFRRFLKNSFLYSSPLGAFKVVAQFAAVPLVYALRMTILGPEVIEFLRDAIWSTVKHRETTGETRGDFLDLLMELRDKGRVQDEDPDTQEKETTFRINMDGDIFVSQSFTFLAAGFETSSSTMTFCLYQLALNQDIQNRLRTEIREIVSKNDGKVTYQAVHEMAYMDMVVAETLRLYPIMPFLDRTCTKPYQLPGTDAVLDKGIRVYISLLGIQMDEQFYPDPERFDPERFSEENKKSRHKNAYMPFGDGPRICIGMRYGLMQAKVGLAHILLNYQVDVCRDTPVPLTFTNNTFLLASVGGLPLVFKRA